MQDHKQENKPLDDDILRCKADIREVMGVNGQSVSDNSIFVQSSQKETSVPAEQTEDDIFLESELAETDSTLDSILLPDSDPPHVPSGPAPVRILSFDAIEQSNRSDQTNKRASEEMHLESTIRTLTDQLQKKTNTLNEQTQRLTFIEKQLQMAAALEQAKTRLQQDNRELNNKNQFLTEENQQLEEDNRKLTAEVSQLRGRMQDAPVADPHDQLLRKELESAELALSQERALIRNLESAAKTLEDNLAAVTEAKHHVSEKLEITEQGLEQLNLKYDQLQDMHERFRQQEDDELSTVKGHLKDARDNSQKLQGDLEQTRDEYEAFQTQANGEIHTLTENMDLLKNENKKLHDEIGRFKENQQHTKDVSEKLKNVEVELKNARQELQDERTCTGNLQQECEQLTVVIADMRREKEEFLNQLQERQSAESQLRDEISRLRDIVKSGESIQNELLAARGEIDRMNDFNQSLQHQLDDLRQAAPVSQENVSEPNKACAESIECQTEAPGSIPVFNLAEQIMEEHRRSVANRRQRREPAPTLSHGNSIQNIVQHYVSLTVPAANTDNEGIAVAPHPWINHSLTPFQQEILHEIVRNDMDLYAHKRPAAGRYSSMNN